MDDRPVSQQRITYTVRVTRAQMLLVGFACIVVAEMGNHFFPDWGRVILLSTLAFGGATTVMRCFWAYWWFWTVDAVLLIVHLFFLRRIQALLGHQNISELLLLAAAEGFVIAMILWLTSACFALAQPD